jgi:hypothetical protein
MQVQQEQAADAEGLLSNNVCLAKSSKTNKMLVVPKATTSQIFYGKLIIHTASKTFISSSFSLFSSSPSFPPIRASSAIDASFYLCDVISCCCGKERCFTSSHLSSSLLLSSAATIYLFLVFKISDQGS